MFLCSENEYYGASVAALLLEKLQYYQVVQMVQNTVVVDIQTLDCNLGQ